jgi:hypothetical protein
VMEFRPVSPAPPRPEHPFRGLGPYREMVPVILPPPLGLLERLRRKWHHVRRKWRVFFAPSSTRWHGLGAARKRKPRPIDFRRELRLYDGRRYTVPPPGPGKDAAR